MKKIEAENFFMFLDGYGMCPVGSRAEIWNSWTAEGEGNSRSFEQEDSRVGEKCHWWKGQGK